MKENTDFLSITLDSKTAGPSVIILAGVHGDEYEPMWAIQRLNACIRQYLYVGKVVLVPVVNLTAYEGCSRVGIDSLDLARVCPGNPLGSETMKAAAAVSSLIRQSEYLIDLHTGGRLFDIYPMVGYMLHSNSEILAKQRQMAKNFGLPGIWGTDIGPNGRTLSVARDAEIPAIYAEYGGPGPVRDEVINSYVEGCMRVLDGLGMLLNWESIKTDWLGYQKFFKEDNKPQSGYLQGKMAAINEGVFKPLVKVGQLIERGQPWGDILNPLTGECNPVFAEASGIVLFIRSEPYIKKGESLGGILELE